MLLSNLTFANGEINYIKGTVNINGQVVSKGMHFKLGDNISTLESSLAILRLEDGSTIKLNQNSSFKVDHLATPTKPTEASLLFGSAFAHINKNEKKNTKDSKDADTKFMLRAKSVAMGIRGTTFFISMGKEKSNDVWMCVNEGIVAIKSDEEKEEKLVKQGEGVKVLDGKKTSKPAPLPWTQNLNWNLEHSGNADLENKINIEEAYNNPLEFYYD